MASHMKKLRIGLLGFITVFFLPLGSEVLAGSPRETFQDCDACHTLVVVPAGRFRMGDLAGTVGAAFLRIIH